MSTTIKGRGAGSHLPGRFERSISQAEDDGWHPDDSEEFAAPRLRTQVREETARSIISRNQSPDVGFSQSVNPYRGCEHGLARDRRPLTKKALAELAGVSQLTLTRLEGGANSRARAIDSKLIGRL
jgi:hypothetical protein